MSTRGLVATMSVWRHTHAKACALSLTRATASRKQRSARAIVAAAAAGLHGRVEVAGAGRVHGRRGE